MVERLQIWFEIHDGLRHLENIWTIGFGSLMLLWPILLYAAGINVFESAWYWLTMLL